MPRTIKIDFYRTVDTGGDLLDVADAILAAAALPFEQRRVDVGEEGFVCLHNARPHHDGNILGEVLKAKMTELPDKVSRARGLPEDLGLEADEGIGHRAHFYYDRHYQTLLLQRNREVRSSAFVSSVSIPTNRPFGLAFIFKRGGIQNLDRIRVIRKIAFRLSSFDGQRAIQDLDPSAARAIELLGDTGGRQIEVNMYCSPLKLDTSVR